MKLRKQPKPVMTTAPKTIKWHTIDSAAAGALTAATSAPGIIYPMGTNAVPEQLKPISGVASYYVTGYVTPQIVANGLTVGGEMLVARIDGATAQTTVPVHHSKKPWRR